MINFEKIFRQNVQSKFVGHILFDKLYNNRNYSTTIIVVVVRRNYSATVRYDYERCYFGRFRRRHVYLVGLYTVFEVRNIQGLMQ